MFVRIEDKEFKKCLVHPSLDCNIMPYDVCSKSDFVLTTNIEKIMEFDDAKLLIVGIQEHEHTIYRVKSATRPRYFGCGYAVFVSSHLHWGMVTNFRRRQSFKYLDVRKRKSKWLKTKLIDLSKKIKLMNWNQKGQVLKLK